MAVRRLRYADANVLGVSSGALTTHVFSLNGLYDPNITGTGHQPMGFDQIMPFYNHYHVVRCRAHVTFACMDGSDRRGSVALKITPDTNPPTDIYSLIEEGRNVVEPISGPMSSEHGTKVLRCDINVPAVNGLSRANLLADTDYAGGIGLNPAEQTYLHICAWSTNLDNITVRFEVVLEYEAVFTEPRNLTSSLPALTASLKEPEAKRDPTQLRITIPAAKGPPIRRTEQVCPR